MSKVADLVREGKKEEIWTKFCGYLDLSIDEFMVIQEQLLMEQIKLLHQSFIGKRLLGENLPESVEEFRKNVPLTTYGDYVDFLEEMREDVLPSGEYQWAHTSGRSGEYRFKWSPYTKRMYDRLGEVAIGAMILASCSYRGDVNLEPGDAVLLATAPPPYMSGLLSHSTDEMGDFRFVPSLEEGEKMQFGERIAEGFNQGMEYGLDYFYGLASVLVRIGERFGQGSGSMDVSSLLSKPRMLLRVLRGLLTAKLQRRSMLPRDIWKLKGIMTGGTDTDIYREKIQELWGKMPLEGYACTEGGTMAMQSWNYQGMTFFPDTVFLEFIPFEDHLKSMKDPAYQPQTYLYNELKPGIYELVFTNLLGGVFTRYRVGDLFEMVTERDEELGIDLPQMRFYSRCNDLIDLAGFARLSEKSIWQSIEACGVRYVDWLVRKEEAEDELMLHFYIEPANGHGYDLKELGLNIDHYLKSHVSEYADYVSMLGEMNIKITMLQAGTWACYMEEQQKAGVDLAHTKPPHIQPSDEIIARLIDISQR